MKDKEQIRMTTLSLKIAYYRKLQGMSAAELAELVGLAEGYIWQLEAPNVHKCPSLKTLYQIADALGVPISKLLEE